jgi:hypothetical protein
MYWIYGMLMNDDDDDDDDDDMGVKLGLTLREKHRLRMFENRVLR